MHAGASLDTPVRAAATVVVVRRRDQRIYGVVRSSTATFMPNALVFPGGRVDPADWAACAQIGAPPAAQRVSLIDQALACIPDEGYRAAAARELAEEARMQVSIADLSWFDTWLTPSAEARRFLARFYVVHVDDDIADRAAHDGQEVVGSRWGHPAELLASAREGELDLPPPTLSIVEWLATQAALADEQARSTRSSPAAGPMRAMVAADVEVPILPKFVLSSRGQGLIVLPHSEHYATAPGESGPAPRRLWERNYPRRVIRRAGRWERVPDDASDDDLAQVTDAGHSRHPSLGSRAKHPPSREPQMPGAQREPRKNDD